MKIRFLIMDVDGTLTDGKIYVGEHGEIMKAFNIKDGCGIKDILPKYGIIPVIITARQSKMLELRCNELDITELYQNTRDKPGQLDRILEKYSFDENMQYSYANCAYIGDDILDIPCMEKIKEAGGLIGCPADAVPQVLEIADFISEKNGGDGAVREFIESLISTVKQDQFGQ